jgi:hypothetical protein
MKTNLKYLLPVGLLLCSSLPAFARISQLWTFEQLGEKSDLIVIARPVSSTPTEEKATLPNISPTVHVTGVETKLEIRLVLKGWPKTKTACLNHYAFANPADSRLHGAAQLLTFDPKQPTRYLMFLKQTSAGRFVPVAGQTDPAAESIIKLETSAQ